MSLHSLLPAQFFHEPSNLIRSVHVGVGEDLLVQRPRVGYDLRDVSADVRNVRIRVWSRAVARDYVEIRANCAVRSTRRYGWDGMLGPPPDGDDGVR